MLENFSPFKKNRKENTFEPESPEVQELFERIKGDLPPAVLVVYKKVKGTEKKKAFLQRMQSGIEEMKKDEEEKEKRKAEKNGSEEHPYTLEEKDVIDRESVVEANLKEEDVIELLPEPEINMKEEMQGSSEQTPKEWREKLKGLILSAKEKTGEAIERAGEKFEKSKEYLTVRGKEIGEKAKNFDPKIEQTFRSMGEKYNKLSTREKIGIGIALGLGAGGLAAASVPAAFVFFGGIAAQRTAGLASMFMRYEKSTQDGKWKKEKAMGKAMLYTAGMTAGMLVLVEGVKEGTEWLSHHWPSGHIENIDNAIAQKVVPPEALHPAVAAYEVSVDAKAGHGYEWMMKRIWEQLQDKDIDASKFGENTDIHKLIDATPETIDKVVHQIAADPQHGFFNADGTSVQINPDDHLSILPDGQIHIANETYDYDIPVHAPEGAHVTQAHPASMDSGQVPEAPAVPVAEAPSASPELTQPVEPFTLTAETPAPTPPEVAVETSAPAVEQPDVSQPELPQTPIESSHNVEVPAVSETVTNHFGLAIPSGEPNFYADAGAKHIFAYGGSPAERADAILKYLTDHPDKIVYGTDDTGAYRIPWHLVEGKLTPGMPVQTSGFLGFFKSFMKAPGPEEFEKFIK